MTGIFSFPTSGSGFSSGSGSTAGAIAKSTQRQMRALEANLAKAMLINEALWEIMRDKHNLSIDDLHEKLYEIDMRDGVLDGKNQRQRTNCPKCDRVVSSRHAACIYCGEVIDNSVFNIT